MQASAALTEAESLVTSALHLAHHENPERQQQHERDRINQDRNPIPAARFMELQVHALIPKRLIVIGVIHRSGGVKLRLVRQRSVNVRAADSDLLHSALIHIVHEFGEGHLLVRGSAARLHDYIQKHSHTDQNDPEYRRFYVRIHSISLTWQAVKTETPATTKDAVRTVFDSIIGKIRALQYP